MRSTVLLLGLAALALAGCQKKEETAATPAGLFGWGGHKARYFGVGMYLPSKLWTQLVRTGAPTDPAAATLDDDDEIIVVLDSTTGELRQCGNLSGHCIGMNPWANRLDPAHAAPARLLKHAKQLREEAEAAAEAEARKAKARVHVRIRAG
jgi:hypothetical protein